MNGEGRPGGGTETAQEPDKLRPSLVQNRRTESSQVNWYDAVYLFVEPWLAAAGSWPMAGTIAWQLLDEADPAKWAAILDAAQLHILRVETAQEARAQASRDISGAADWPKIGWELQRLCNFRRSAPWSRRVRP